ncbi:MAG: hypothetical protein V3S64_17830 [bacterium]
MGGFSSLESFRDYVSRIHFPPFAPKTGHGFGTSLLAGEIIHLQSKTTQYSKTPVGGTILQRLLKNGPGGRHGTGCGMDKDGQERFDLSAKTPFQHHPSRGKIGSFACRAAAFGIFPPALSPAFLLQIQRVP